MKEEEKKGHVLVVESEELMRELMVTVLEKDSVCLYGGND